MRVFYVNSENGSVQDVWGDMDYLKNLSKGVRIEVDEEDKVQVYVTINIAYGYAIPEVSRNVQEKIKSAIENMTGLEVSGVNVRIADVDMKGAAE